MRAHQHSACFSFLNNTLCSRCCLIVKPFNCFVLVVCISRKNWTRTIQYHHSKNTNSRFQCCFFCVFNLIIKFGNIFNIKPKLLFLFLIFVTYVFKFEICSGGVEFSERMRRTWFYIQDLPRTPVFILTQNLHSVCFLFVQFFFTFLNSKARFGRVY